MRRFIFLVLISLMHNIHAQDIYKWKDAEGKIHFGDRSKAPVVSKKVDIKVKEVSKTEITNQATLTTTTAPKLAPEKKVGGIELSKINPKCKTIIEEIEKIPMGIPWHAQYNEFNQLCPGIAWQCNVYERTPEKNLCGWIERTSNNILSKRTYQ